MKPAERLKTSKNGAAGNIDNACREGRRPSAVLKGYVSPECTATATAISKERTATW